MGANGVWKTFRLCLGGRRQVLPDPFAILLRERRLGRASVDEILVSGGIVDVVEDFLEVDPGVGVGVGKRDGDHGKPLPEPDRPESGPRAMTRATDQGRVGTRGTIGVGHGPTAAQQVDLDQMGGAGQERRTLGEILRPVVAFVGQAEHLQDRDGLASVAVPDLQISDPFDLLGGVLDLGRCLGFEEGGPRSLAGSGAATSKSARRRRPVGSAGGSWT